MTTSSWTRGYIISQKTHYIYCETPEGDCEDVCKVCDSTTDEKTEERVRLITAAPDLLAALKEALVYMGIDINEEIDTRIRAAIAKAEGAAHADNQ